MKVFVLDKWLSTTYLCYIYWIITRYEIITGFSVSYDFPKLEYPEIKEIQLNYRTVSYVA